LGEPIQEIGLEGSEPKAVSSFDFSESSLERHRREVINSLLYRNRSSYFYQGEYIKEEDSEQYSAKSLRYKPSKSPFIPTLENEDEDEDVGVIKEVPNEDEIGSSRPLQNPSVPQI